MAGDLQRQKLIFALVDGTAAAVAFTLALALHDPKLNIRNSLLAANPLALVGGAGLILAVWVMVFREADLYVLRYGGWREAMSVLNACTVASILTVVCLFLIHMPDIPRVTLVLGGVFSIPLVLTFRIALRGVLRRWYYSPRVSTPVIILGFNSIGRYLLDRFLDGMSTYEPLGFLDEQIEPGQQYRGYPLLGTSAELGQFAETWPNLRVAIALPEATREEQERLITICERYHLDWTLVPWITRTPSNGLRVDQMGALLLLSPRRSSIVGTKLILKRAVDLIAASALLLITAPIAMFAAGLIWMADGSPILFRQKRIGLAGQPFELLKLRTMYRDAADTPHREFIRHWIEEGSASDGFDDRDTTRLEVFKLVDDQRITPVGKYLRRFSIDELPQLINVLRGEMSLIGPRPALPYELELYQSWHRGRLDAIPGITGLWQVSGRNRLSFDEMVQLDLDYLGDWSLLSDFKILLRTFPALVRGSGS